MTYYILYSKYDKIQTQGLINLSKNYYLVPLYLILYAIP
jgi:hypothetical protein